MKLSECKANDIVLIADNVVYLGYHFLVICDNGKPSYPSAYNILNLDTHLLNHFPSNIEVVQVKS